MPITIIKVRFESTLYHYTSIAQAVRDIYSKERITGFFRGSGATIARDAPYAGLYVGLYEWWKVTLSKIASSDNSNKMVLLSLNRDANANAHTHTQPLSVSKSAMVNSSAALLSASLATTLTAPFDTIKTRMQLKPGEFRTFVASAVAVVKHEGWRNLFDGLGLRLARKAMSAGIAWGIYEEIVKFVVVK
jgi:solute carrier family 25 protein 38